MRLANRPRRRLRSLNAALAAVALTVGAAACGGGGGGGEAGQDGKLETVTVGTLPLASSAPLFLGRKLGYFKQEGIEVRPQLAQGGAEVTAGVQSGSFSFGYAGVIPVVVAKSKGLPVKIVATTDDQLQDASEADVITVAQGDSDIKTAKDLEGATVAVNSLRGVAEVVIKGSVEKDGGDPSKVELLEVPFPDMVTALDQKRVDAAFIPEPFLLQSVERGARVIESCSYQAVDPKGLELGIYIASEKYIADNADVVKRFTRALNRATEHAADHPDEVREIIGTYTEIPPELIAKIKLPRWDSQLRRESVQLQADLTRRYGIIEEPPNLDELIL